jgi:D-tyrosyl-tRNA(Tyr) deacylase
MKALIQRVSSASVHVDGQMVGQIAQGLLVFLGIEPNDNERIADTLLQKVLAYRVFADAEGKMNVSLKERGAELLVVSQFTLVADTHKGLRPSFSSAASPSLGKKLYDYWIREARKSPLKVETGQFGSDMQVSLVNDGPVTFLLHVDA